ncbi:uncharacterized protein LOC109015696 [Juglans regia]|uniref:Uncharacterized protein LOC109015696 n=1 Tax=Juglans regia TaxID=51240 RepID=A0A2I4GAW5_JUGRE|nr:uncharacterized protein LOC109015696 [Juglans regia]
MAANLIPFRPSRIRACATSDHRNPDQNRPTSVSSPNWWTPIFGWSAEPDYIDSGSNKQIHNGSEKSDQDLYPKSSRTKFTPGSFTEEKARQLRMMTKETESFHDVMYHSAIASRLASDFKKSSDL